MKPPEGMSEIALVWLDNLRRSGKVNMFGAAPLLAEHFALSEDVAGEWLAYWMMTFSERQPKGGDSPD